MLCKLIEVGFLICMSNKPGIKEIECIKLSETTICVDVKEDIGCLHDSADDYMMGNKYDELGLTHWLNANCDGFVGGRYD